MVENCYIHIPFCKSKCKYCSFVSLTCLEKITVYVYSLLKEISSNYGGEELKTLYIGGGTPSLLQCDLLGKILKKLNFCNECECTVEVNPDDVTSELAKYYLDKGINRISIGIQTFNEDILSEIGRRHSAVRAMQAVNILADTGFKNISADFIYGLPRQTAKMFINDLKLAINLPLQHISLYGLKIEENSYYSVNPPQNLPDDDLQADMYIIACEFLENNGFIQYEISNFARPNYYSRHNKNYWDNNSYYGFGLSAHGYVNGFRYYNTSDLDAYISAPAQSEYAHFITDKERLEEEIFLGLRKTEGINTHLINKKFNIDFAAKYKNVLGKYSPQFLENNNGHLRLTRRGGMLSNLILSEFI